MTDCCTSCTPGGGEPAIACTLGAGDYRERLAAIRDLAARALHGSRRDGLRLELDYDLPARAEVEALVAQERACCPFLDFDLHAEAGAVRLTITAPERAREAADELFAHFAPGRP